MIYSIFQLFILVIALPAAVVLLVKTYKEILKELEK